MYLYEIDEISEEIPELGDLEPPFWNGLDSWIPLWKES